MISRRVGSSAVAVSAMRGIVREALVQDGQLQVLGPEVVAPLGDAVRLVDGEERAAGARQKIEVRSSSRRSGAM